MLAEPSRNGFHLPVPGGQDFESIAQEYHQSVIDCQNALGRLERCRREFRQVTNSSDSDREPPDLQADRLVSQLSRRELEVFSLIGQGLATGEIAKRLNISLSTVETYRERLKTKLNLEGGSALIRCAVLWLKASR